MNQNNKIDLEKRIKNSKKISLNPLEIKIKSKNKTKKFLAINELSLFRQSKQTVSLS